MLAYFFFLIDFRDEIYIGNLQALPTLVPYTNPYRSTHPPTFQLTVVLIKKKKKRLFRIAEASSSLDWVVNEATALSSQPAHPPPPKPDLPD